MQDSSACAVKCDVQLPAGREKIEGKNPIRNLIHIRVKCDTNVTVGIKVQMDVNLEKDRAKLLPDFFFYIFRFML